jgi:hypothetical protein
MRVGKGVGLAEDMPDAGSFGAAYGKLVAQAMLQARAANHIVPEAFQAAFLAVCRSENLDAPECRVCCLLSALRGYALLQCMRADRPPSMVCTGAG